MGHKSFYKNTVWQFLLTAVKYLLPFIVLPYLTRVLEPTGYAVYAYVAAFMTFIQVLIDFGFNLSGTKSIARAKSAKELSKTIAAITQARVILCLIAGLFCLIFFLILPIMRENFLYSLLAFVAVCGRGLSPDYIFQGKEKMGPITTRYIASKGVSTILTFMVVRSPIDILWIPILDIIASTIALIWSFMAAKRMFGIFYMRVDFSDSLIELKRSGYYCLSNIASTSFTGLTTLIIGLAVTDTAQIAYWSLAMTAVNAVQALYGPITNSLYAHMVSTNDFNFAKRLALLSMPVMIIGFIGFLVLSDFIVIVLGGEEYIAGAYVMRQISPVLLFSFYGMYFGWPVLGAIGKVKELTATTFISAIFGVIALMFAWIIGDASLTAFCISRSITEALMCLLRVIMSFIALDGLEGK